MKKILFVIVCFFFTILKPFAFTYYGCDVSEVSLFKSYVGNVNLYYSYRTSGDAVYFDITLANIVPGMYFIDNFSNKTYYYSDTRDGEITIKGYINGVRGQYTFYYTNGKCKDYKLGYKYYNIPTYNQYFESQACKENPNYVLCKKWMKTNISYNELLHRIDEYNKKPDTPQKNVEHVKTLLEKILEIYVKYYFVFFAALILVCGSIILIKRKKDSFKI